MKFIHESDERLEATTSTTTQLYLFTRYQRNIEKLGYYDPVYENTTQQLFSFSPK